MRNYIFATIVGFLLITNTSFAAVSYSQSVTLEPGWSIVSTPRILESHTFSTSSNQFSIFTLDPSRPSGWATMADLGQTEFTPLYGYFINNQTATSQILTFNYKSSTTPNERLFERIFTTPGWYAIGVANPSYAKIQGEDIADTDNPDQILNSLLGITAKYSSVIDFTKGTVLNPDSVSLVDPWDFRLRSSNPANTTEINSLNDFRETKGYAIYVSESSSSLVGFQNANTPECTDGVDNDGDVKSDYPQDPGCSFVFDDDESNLPSGSFDLVKNSAYANQTITVPQTAYKIGEYRFSADASDNYTLNVVGLGLFASTTPLSSLTDIYLVINGVPSEVIATGTDALYWIDNATFPAGSSSLIQVYANLPASMPQGEELTTWLSLGVVSQNSGDFYVIDPLVEGQTITTAVGSLTTILDVSTPVSSLVVANSMPKIASFKYTAQNDTFTLVDVGVTVGSTNAATTIAEIVFKDGATELKRVPMNGLYATGTALNVMVPGNSTKIVDVYANLGGIGTGFALSGQNVGVTLSSTKYRNSNGVEAYENTSRAGNAIYAYKTKPTITNVALPTSVLTAGTQTIGKVTITADAGGTVSWRKLFWTYSTSTGVSLASVALYDSANESSALSGMTVTLDQNAGTITASSTAGAADQEVSGSKTYVLKAVVGEADGLDTGDSVSTRITAPSSYAAPAGLNSFAGTESFLWSDESVSGHSATTPDWMNDYLVKNLPTDTQTLTK